MKISFSGVVKKHLGRGAELGYPTANIEVPPETEEGVFFGYTVLDGRSFPSVIFIGAPETFGEDDKRLETHLLDFSGELYDEHIEVEIVRKLRENRNFPDAEALVEQMRRDEQDARSYFSRKGEK